MDRDTFIACIKTDDTYKVFREDVETRFDTSSYELDKPLMYIYIYVSLEERREIINEVRFI